MTEHAEALLNMRRYFDAGHTLSYAFRRQQLQKLKKVLLSAETEIAEALFADLGKNPEEVWITETGFLVGEINHTLKHLKKWMKAEKVRTNLLNQPSRSYVYKEPLGVALIIGPWNYPLMLLLAPLVGAMAAGNCAVLKPGEAAPATAALIQRLICENFAPEYVKVVEGEGHEIIPSLMDNSRFDHVFFTGSTAVGKKIYALAAEKLTPVTLELGGKSPCLVTETANIEVTARRIAATKFSNAGQMCVAPDYVLVQQSIKESFVAALIRSIRDFYGADPAQDYHYGRLINRGQLGRLKEYLDTGSVIYGGSYDEATHYMEPTLLENVSLDTAVMGDEIFGPILPIVSYNAAEEALSIINRNPEPLAFYIFSTDKEEQEKWLQAVPAGGCCVNNASWHLTNYNLPFGGRGNSGIGRYHGRYSFDTFSHQKAVMKTPLWFDPALKYPPYKGKLKLLKRIIR
ncbi:MAG: aldehyde dehydrogenase [Flavisolibacter sp.]